MNQKWLFPACVLAVLALGITTAFVAKPNPNFTHGEFSFSTQTQSSIEPSGQMQKIALPAGITALQQMGTINLEQACGNEASVEIDTALLAVLDPALLARGIIKSNEENISTEMPAITVHTAKPLQQIDTSGTATATITCADPQQFAINNRGTGSVLVKTAKIDTATVDNYGVGDVQLADVKTIQINNWGTGNVWVNNAEQASVHLYGVGNVAFANAPQISSSVKGAGEIQTNSPRH